MMLESDVYQVGETSLENQMSAERRGFAGRRPSVPGNDGAQHAKWATTPAPSALAAALILVLGTVSTSHAQSEHKPGEAAPAGTQSLPADESPESLARMPRAHADEFTNDADRAAWDELLKIDPAVGDTSGSLGPTGIRSHAPAFALEYRKVFRLMQSEFGLAPEEFEFNVLLACRYADNETEWGDHEPRALKAGIPAAVVEMVRDRKFDRSALNEKQRASVDLAKALATSPPQRVDSKTFKALQDAYGRRGALGVTVIMAYYTANAVILHTYDQKVDLSKRTRPFPDLAPVERKN